MRKIVTTVSLALATALPIVTFSGPNTTNPCVPGSHACTSFIGGSITIGQNRAKSDDIIEFSGKEIVVGDSYICKTSAPIQGARGYFLAKNYIIKGGVVSGAPLQLTHNTLFIVTAKNNGYIEFAVGTQHITSSNPQGPQLTIQCLADNKHKQ